jgi:hypothetical protein
MATLAPQRISVTIPGNIADFLRKRAEAEAISIDDALADVVVGVMEDEKDKINDPVLALFEFHKSSGLTSATADEYLQQVRYDRKNWGQCPK